ncbi:ParB/RepB/Spo0J family partition protein [Streptomyces sp. NPDC093982]|uniref:ParB/RepB/Spo0J family partition protein n=1 Tax=Streptomyces sp. NPDC093982 TaxID=3155077 RepID=UPI00341A88E7
MSKADTLGNSSAFGAARTARSSRRTAINNAIGGDEAASAAITELPLTLISDNPDNPRDHLRNLDETVQTVHEVGVLLPIIVATVDAYLRERPGRASDLDDGAKYLVIDGHRRLEAARRVGLATIPVRVDNARVATDEALLEAAFVANYHRDDMTDLEEAHALQALVDYYGNQTKASKRLGIPQATISTKLSLLKLSPELQKDLVSGTRTVEHVRNLGKLSPAEQKQKADERAAADRSNTQQKPPQPPQPADPPAEKLGDTEQLSRRDNPEAKGQDNPQQGDGAEQSLPEPRSHNDAPAGDDQSSGQQPKRFPYGDGAEAAMHLIHKMPADEFNRMLDLLIKHRDSEAVSAG